MPLLRISLRILETVVVPSEMVMVLGEDQLGQEEAVLVGEEDKAEMAMAEERIQDRPAMIRV